MGISYLLFENSNIYKNGNKNQNGIPAGIKSSWAL